MRQVLASISGIWLLLAWLFPIPANAECPGDPLQCYSPGTYWRLDPNTCTCVCPTDTPADCLEQTGQLNHSTCECFYSPTICDLEPYACGCPLNTPPCDHYSMTETPNSAIRVDSCPGSSYKGERRKTEIQEFWDSLAGGI